MSALVPEIFWRLGVSRVEDGPDALDQAFGLCSGWTGRTPWRMHRRWKCWDRSRVFPEESASSASASGAAGLRRRRRVTAPDVLVSYYGSWLPDPLGLRRSVDGAASLHHFGLADSYLGRRMVEQIRETLAAPAGRPFESYPTVPTTRSTTPTSISTTLRPLHWPGNAPPPSWTIDCHPNERTRGSRPPARMLARWVATSAPGTASTALSATDGALTGSRPTVPRSVHTRPSPRPTTGRRTSTRSPTLARLPTTGGCCSCARAASRSPGWRVRGSSSQDRPTACAGSDQGRRPEPAALRTTPREPGPDRLRGRGRARRPDPGRHAASGHGGRPRRGRGSLSDRRLAAPVVVSAFLSVPDPRRSVLDAAIADACSVRIGVTNA